MRSARGRSVSSLDTHPDHAMSSLYPFLLLYLAAGVVTLLIGPRR